MTDPNWGTTAILVFGIPFVLIVGLGVFFTLRSEARKDRETETRRTRRTEAVSTGERRYTEAEFRAMYEAWQARQRGPVPGLSRGRTVRFEDGPAQPDDEIWFDATTGEVR